MFAITWDTGMTLKLIRLMCPVKSMPPDSSQYMPFPRLVSNLYTSLHIPMTSSSEMRARGLAQCANSKTMY